MTACRLLLVVVFGWVIAGSAWAHDPGLSSANLTRTPVGLKVTLTFAWPDLALLKSAGESSDLGSIEATAPPKFGPEWTSLTAEFAQVVADGVVQSPTKSEIAQSSEEINDVVISLEWAQVPATAVRVEFPVLSRLPFGHRMVLTLGNASEPVALLRERLRAWELPAPAVSAVISQPAGAEERVQPEISWTSFVLLGVEHILMGFDHLCFLLALLIVAPRLRDVIGLVTTFTVAHSLTLAAAALGLVSMSPRIVEPLIAASIVYIGIENLVLSRPPRYRLVLVFAFGLIHGLGFASILADRLPGMSGMAVVPPLLAFNGGVELGQLAVAACLVPLIRLARTQPRIAPRLQPAVSVVIATAGVIWFFQRV